MSIIAAILQTSGRSLSNSVTQSQFGELPILVIKHKTCTAAVSLQGGQLLFWQPTKQTTPVIWLSDKAIFKKGKAIRGGVPICWPWFANLGEPAHGFARTVEWTVDSVTENEQGVDLALSLTNNPQTEPLFTKPFTLSLAIHVGQSCQIELTALGDFEITSALHTYFGVDNIVNVVVNGLSSNYIEKLTTVNRSPITGQMRFNQEVDRIYTDVTNMITINDQKRTIQIRNNNATDVVTWNPWIDKTKTMQDMPDESYKTMVCIETGIIQKPLKLSPTEKTSYGCSIEVL